MSEQRYLVKLDAVTAEVVTLLGGPDYLAALEAQLTAHVNASIVGSAGEKPEVKADPEVAPIMDILSTSALSGRSVTDSDGPNPPDPSPAAAAGQAPTPGSSTESERIERADGVTHPAHPTHPGKRP